MRDIIYWQEADKLIYLDEKPTPEFWDARWEKEGKPPPVNPKDDVIVVTRKYLAPSARVLEGGCGRANKVQALADAGFTAVGIDFAEDTVEQARRIYKDIDVRKGDVRSLEFPDDYFDGYWSIGVIEHFWDGYGEILSEAARVLRPGGFLFLTAPWFSPYRKRRARDGSYTTANFTSEPDSFYQFALSREEVCAELARHGFQLKSWHGWVSEISMREDMTRFRRQIDWLLGSRGSIFKRVLRRLIARSLDGYCGHSFLAVVRRNA